MRIETFEDIISEHQLSRETLEGIRKRLQGMSAGAEKIQFTSLQKTAFNTPGFWREDGDEAARHMIVQGATSSGKTLVSEIAIMDCLKSRKKAIVLVPLKAMVRERWEHFRDDLAPQGTKQVYASSSDFQDHDGDIVNGDYEVAVIVYEKFFAMLSQSNINMMQDCALLVVDELQMLSSRHRGPKLEIAIQKILRSNSDARRNAVAVRIMCLTTCDCKVSYIREWLTICENGQEKGPILIESQTRPTGLKEHVIGMDGTWRMKYIHGEQSDGKEKPKDEGNIDVPGYDADNKPEMAKRLLLKALLQKIYAEKPDAKVLIFANTRNRTYRLASFLAEQNVLPYQKLSGAMEDISQYEGDDYQKQLKDQLLPRRMAFHNAALSTALREYIEDIYQKEEKLCVVVATETLTIGMNMPVDVMILFDTKVMRENGEEKELTSQEYKNFAGRAGRLGQNKGVGESYIFAVTKMEYDKYWDEYVNCRTEEIGSALSNAGLEVLAPYFLSLLGDGSYDSGDFRKLWEDSFAYKCHNKRIDITNMIQKLQNAYLCQKDASDDDDDGEERYRLTDLGRMMAPYAFRLDSCKRLRRFFFNGGYKKRRNEQGKMEWQKMLDEGQGGLPGTVTKKDMEEDKYLLDMLYALCRTEEVVQLGQLKLPSADKRPDKSREALDQVEAQLRKMITPDEGEEALCQVWPQSALANMLENGYLCETEEKEAVMRAILLWHWTKGERIEEIKRKTGFGSITSIVSGDMARMAEMVSYQMESIHHCYGGYKGYTNFQPKALQPLYALSTRVNYGMPRNLVIIANCHVRGLDRKTILDIGDLAKKSGRYDSPVNFLKEATVEELEGKITDQKRKELLRFIDGLYLRDNLEILLDNIQKHQQGSWQLTSEEYAAVMDLSRMENDAEGDSPLTPLEKIFPTDDFFTKGEDGVNNRFFHEPSLRIQLLDDNHIAKLVIGEVSFAIGVYDGDEGDAKRFDRYIASNQYCNILLVRREEFLEKIRCGEQGGGWDLVDEEGKAILHGIHSVITNKMFAGLIAQDMALNDNRAAALAALLLDTQGIFRSAGLQALRPLLKNYDISSNQQLDQENSSQPILRILCDERIGLDNGACNHLFDELQRRGIRFRVLQWGTSLDRESPSEAPTLMYLNWEDVKKSKSLYRFHQRMKANHYHNAFAVFESEEAFRRWGTENIDLPCNELDHCMQMYDYKNIAQKAEYLISQFEVPKYLIGVSYAHAKDGAGERPAVTALRRIIERINEAFLESVVLFDGNPSCVGHFDGNGAILATLSLYEQCSYFIVLDDQYYDDSGNCEREGRVIAQKLKSLPAHHLWFLHPDNDRHCFLYEENRDYSTRLDLTDDATEKIAEDIISFIKEDENGGRS